MNGPGTAQTVPALADPVEVNVLDPTFIGPVLPCREWAGYANDSGYGERSAGLVHRLTWIDHFGPPPPDKPFVLHRCDNPPCYEITHLWCGTQADNVADMTAKGRHGMAKKTHCPHGHPYDESNTIERKGKRWCRACHNASSNAARTRRRKS